MESVTKNLDITGLNDVLPDLPKGPLDDYRSRASFDWKKLKLLIEGEEIIRFKNRIFKTLENDPLFDQKPWTEMTRDEERRKTFLRLKKLHNYKFISNDDMMRNPFLLSVQSVCFTQYCSALAIKKTLSTEYFILSTNTSSSEYHSKVLDDVESLNAMGALCITELGHGSNVQGLQTTATFDRQTQEFVINTPCIEATKVWSGVVGQTATHITLFAQLYTPDGVCHGPHTFLVPIRDQKTFLPFSGVIVGDMGPKSGLNGLDNGFIQFKNYRIPKFAINTKSIKITPEGEYVVISGKKKDNSASLGMLSMGRVNIIAICNANLQMAIAIAVRYSAVRKQFGPPGEEEWPVMEYSMQQWRLFPYIAASYVINNFFSSFFNDYLMFTLASFSGQSDPDTGAEIHALSCAAKALSAWIARDGIQESREACGGHGYLKASRIGSIKADHEPNLTYEGDGNMILMQTSNYLLKFYKEKQDHGKPIQSPLGSVDFLNDMDAILTRKLSGGITNLENVLYAYEYLCCYSLNESVKKLAENLDHHSGELFTAKSETQVYYLRTLALLYLEYQLIKRYQDLCSDESIPTELLRILKSLGLLYGLWSLEKHMAILYASGFIQISNTLNQLTEMKDNIMNLCKSLKYDAVSLVDVFAPPDFILNSSLGSSDGRVYEHLMDALTKNTGAFKKPDWLKAPDNLPENVLTHIKSKL